MGLDGAVGIIDAHGDSAMGCPGLSLVALLCLLNSPGEPDYIPLVKGHYWIYQAKVQWVEADPATGKNETRAKALTWRSEIVDTVPLGPRGVAALVHGWPGDLIGYNSTTQPSDRILFRIGTDYYQIKENALALFDLLKKSNGNINSVREQLSHAELFLPTPLALHKIVQGTPDEGIDGRYCYLVENVRSFDAAEVRNAPEIENPVVYTITYHAAPEIEESEVVPGLGIVHQGYHHNGTKMEVDARLVEVGPAPAKREEPTIP